MSILKQTPFNALLSAGMLFCLITAHSLRESVDHLSPCNEKGKPPQEVLHTKRRYERMGQVQTDFLLCAFRIYGVAGRDRVDWPFRYL